MVFQSLVLFVRAKGPDEFWRKRRIFRLSSHFRGRYRNCYSNAIRAVHRSLQYATKFRDVKHDIARQQWMTRIEAGSMEHGMNMKALKEGLSRCDIQLNHKSLADLAIWEPRSFKSILKIACARIKHDGLNILQNLEKPTGVITKALNK